MSLSRRQKIPSKNNNNKLELEDIKLPTKKILCLFFQLSIQLNYSQATLSPVTSATNFTSTI
jgi:hypothetical protein